MSTFLLDIPQCSSNARFSCTFESSVNICSTTCSYWRW